MNRFADGAGCGQESEEQNTKQHYSSRVVFDYDQKTAPRQTILK